MWEQGIQLVAGVDEAGMAPCGSGGGGCRHFAALLQAQDWTIRKGYWMKQTKTSWPLESSRTPFAGLSGARRSRKSTPSTSIAPDCSPCDAPLKAPKAPEYILSMQDYSTLLYPQRGIIHGDALSASIAAASIIAKTTRDAHMIDLDRSIPATDSPPIKATQPRSMFEF